MIQRVCALMCLCVLAAAPASAQLQRGQVLIGGNITGFDWGLNEGSAFVFTLTPKAALFIQDNAAVGGYADIGLSTAKDAGTSFNWGVGALARLYSGGARTAATSTGTTARSVRLFVEGNVGLQGVNPANGNSTNGLGLGVGPGVAYFITPNVALETLLKYNGIVGFGSSPTSGRLQLNVGFQVFLSGNRVRAEVDRLK